MKVFLENKLSTEWQHVGEFLENTDSSASQTHLGGTSHVELSFESNSYFNSPSGYLILVNDEKALFLVVAFRSDTFWAKICKSPPDMQSVFENSALPQMDLEGCRYLKSDGCFWTCAKPDSGLEAKLTIYGNDLSILSPEDQIILSEADSAADVVKETSRPSSPRTSSSLPAISVNIKNNFGENFQFDGDWIESGSWQRRPDTISSGSTTTLELAADGSVAGCCWFVSQDTKEYYLSLVFTTGGISGGPRFQVWAGAPPPDLKKEITRSGRMKRKSEKSNEGVKWSLQSKTSNSAGLVFNVEVDESLVKFTGNCDADIESDDGESDEQALATIPEQQQAIVPVGDVQDATSPKSTEMVNELMNTTRPKNALSGLGSGLKYIGGGVLAGTAALVSAPIVGAKEEGGLGLLKGVAKGVGGFLGLTVAGVAVGVTQVVRGVANTPEAISKSVRKDYKWDKEKGEWIKDIYNLGDMYKTATQEEEESDREERNERRGTSASSGHVKETLYYDILGVTTEATTQDIKKAYYKKAITLHPDKNPDPEANKQFQQLNQAYQTLSDETSRRKYDQIGVKKFEESSGQMGNIDPRVFFSALFGSLRFEEYVGELSLAGLVKQMMVDGHSAELNVAEVGSTRSRGADKRRQNRRRIFCAVNLKRKLDQWVIHRDQSGFVRSSYLEAAELVKSSFGSKMLATIGWVYRYRAEKYIADQKGHLMTRKWAAWKSTGRSYSNMATVAGNVTKSVMAVNKMAKASEMKNPEAEFTQQEATEMKKQMEESLPLLLETAWSMCQVDIEDTLKISTKMVLKDISVPWQIRIKRAYAMRRLGRIFEEVAGGGLLVGSNAATAIEQLEQAFINSVREADRSPR